MRGVYIQPTLARLNSALQALRSILPSGFVALGALADEALPIPAADLAVIQGAVPQRRAEFVGGRWCAHQALRAVGLPALHLPPGPLGAPCWPAGALGSITHDAGHCLAVAGPASVLRGIGIDWCDDDYLDTLMGVADQILAASERDSLVHSYDPARYLQRVFCAKEAVVKAVSTTLGRFIELNEITIQGDSTEFVARISGCNAFINGVHLSVRAHSLAWAALPK